MLLARWALAWLFLFPAACGEVLPKTPDAPPAPDGLPDGAGAGPTLFWVEANAACDASAIRRLPAGSTVPEDVLSLPGPDQIADVTLEQAGGRAFFTFGQSSANQTETVERVNLDGSGRQAIKTYGQRPTPLGISVDSSSDSVFWLTNGGCSPCPSCGPCSTIESSRRDGTANTTVHTLAGTANPRMVAFDAQNRKLYFCDLQFQPHIQRVNADGTGLEMIYSRPSSDQGGVDDLELDLAGGKIYWLENSLTIGPAVSILRSNLDGTSSERLVSVGGTQDTTPRGIAVDPAGGKIYWTESGFCSSGAKGRIRRANLDGSSVETVVDELGVLVSIEVVR
jgi:hypothetical protein